MFEKSKAFETHPNFQISRNNAPEKKMPVFDVAPLLEADKVMEGLNGLRGHVERGHLQAGSPTPDPGAAGRRCSARQPGPRV